MTAPTRTHRLVGEVDQVAAAIATARGSGRLARVRSARELPGGWVEVIAELKDTHPRDAEGGRWRPWLVALGWVAGLAALAGVVWLVVWLVMAIIALITTVVAWVTAHLVGVALAVGGLLVLLFLCAGAGSNCAGVHCGGCRR